MIAGQVADNGSLSLVIWKGYDDEDGDGGETLDDLQSRAEEEERESSAEVKKRRG